MMFGISKIKFSDMKVRLSEVEDENRSLVKRIKGLEDLLASFNSEVTAAKPMIDFDIMRVFSIERNVNSNKPCTIIGYYMNEPTISSDGEMVVDTDVVKEWTLYCNDARHAELIEEFKQWKAKQNGN